MEDNYKYCKEPNCECEGDAIVGMKPPKKKEIKPKLEWYDHESKQHLISYCGSKDCDTHTSCAYAVGISDGRNQALEEYREFIREADIEGTLIKEWLYGGKDGKGREYKLIENGFSISQRIQRSLMHRQAQAIRNLLLGEGE